MIHLTPQQVSGYLDGELPGASMELVRIHLSACPRCTGWFAHMEALEEVLVRVMAHDPGEDYFEEFVDRFLFQGRRGPQAAGRAAPPHGRRDSAWARLTRVRR